MNGTLRELTQMQARTADQGLPAGPADRELTEQKQRRIVEGASKVLFEQGFHGVSIRDIASACGMSMGQLYHYISSKDDILYLMHRYSQERWYQNLADASFEQMTDPSRARSRAADLDEVPVREPRHDPVPVHREQVPGRGASAAGPRARRQERGAGSTVTCSPRSPERRSGTRETSRPTSSRSSACFSPCVAGTSTCRARPTSTSPSISSSTSSSAASGSIEPLAAGTASNDEDPQGGRARSRRPCAGPHGLVRIPPSTRSREVNPIITAALNGPIATRENNPNLPETPAEIAADAKGATTPARRSSTSTCATTRAT